MLILLATWLWISMAHLKLTNTLYLYFIYVPCTNQIEIMIQYAWHNITGPFRFLGVTPNEESAEKEVKHHSSRVRGRGDQGTVAISAAAENADPETTSSRHAPHIRRYKTAVIFYIYCFCISLHDTTWSSWAVTVYLNDQEVPCFYRSQSFITIYDFFVSYIMTFSVSKLYHVRWLDYWWIRMPLEGSTQGIIKVLSQNFPGGAEEN